ncbi:oxygen-independent coproporphyrinogen III oxidase [Mariprofundus sp. EBB-1]|uniref:oxygen-independent coproporphyrinogen III oxidase n=1 Tax=Mariprofundus sp. EBB-1 TaxID=2650971 RepID=UPI000EF273A7|nr:oxygen-independent coproporphyrinogen III oxidase [Mariprofundus sp. EBB-1]RLL51369.1 oxygen-independent coproporphyrinogen III oxidase [Mariprofundus sp. EBB-1]
MTNTVTDISASQLGGANLFNLEIIKKYDKAGPRYTSYPTAPMFHTGIGAKQYRDTLQRVASDDAPLSLYIHIPFCNTICYYCGCNKIVTKQYDRAEPYLKLLLKEIDRVADNMRDKHGNDCQRPVTQLHFGGGTPTFMHNDQMRAIMNKLRSRFQFVAKDDGEFSIEIDPRECDEDTVAVLEEIGLNRMSMGVQDFDPIVQKAVNRIQSKEETMRVLSEARNHGFESMNIDLMYGLPHQTVETFNATLKTIIEFSPDRIALFNYAHMPHMFMPQRRIDEAAIPTPQEKLNILEHSINTLLDAGYVFIGMDHFAKPEDELTIAQREGKLYRNFQGYSTQADCDLIGLGLTSIGYTGGGFFQNEKDMETYAAAVEADEFAVFRGYILSDEDHLRRQVIMRLMCDFALSYEPFETAFNINFKEHFADGLADLQEMVTDNLVELREDGLSVLPAGRLLIRNIAMVFDEYLQKKKEGSNFSKVI